MVPSRLAMNATLSKTLHHCLVLLQCPHLCYPQFRNFSWFCCQTANWHNSGYVCTAGKRLYSQVRVPHSGRLHRLQAQHEACQRTYYLLCKSVMSKHMTCRWRSSQSPPTLHLSTSSNVLINHKTLARKLLVTSKRLYGNDEKKRPPHHDTVLENLQRLEDSLRYHGYSTVRIGFSVFIIIGIAIYIFRESIRENVADEVTQVATRSLEDQLVALKAEEFSKGLLNALLKDELMHQLASQFVLEVLQRSETRQAMNTLVIGVLQDPNTKTQLTATIKQVIETALNDEDTQAYIKSVLKIILSDKEMRLAVINLLGYVFREAEVKEQTAAFFRDVLRSKVIVDQATQLGKEVTKSVISDPVLQEKTGDSLWSAIVYSITPRWLSSSSPSSPDGGAEGKQPVEGEAVVSELEADEESVLGG